MTARRVLVGDVPLHVLRVDAFHDALTVVPSQAATGANHFARLQVGEATA